MRPLFLLACTWAGTSGTVLAQGEDCSTATPIGSLPASVTGNNSSATDDYNEICPYTNTGGRDQVWSYTPASDEAVTISLCQGLTDFDTKLYVYENSCVSGTAIACNDDACTAPLFNDGEDPYVSRISNLALTAGNTYYIVVDGFDDDADWSMGNYTLVVESAAGPPANDDCANAIIIDIGPPGSCPGAAIEGTTAGATHDAADPSCDVVGIWADVWYTFTTDADPSSIEVNAAFGATGGANDLGVEVLEGGCAGTPVGCGFLGFTPAIPFTVDLQPFTEYAVRVFTNTDFGDPGTFTLCINEVGVEVDPCENVTPIADCGGPVITTIDAGSGSFNGFVDCSIELFPLNGKEYVYSFTPTESGNYLLQVTDLTINTPFTYTDFLYREGSCSGTQGDWNCLLDVNGPSTSDPIPMTAGNTYYFLVKNEGTDGGSATWLLTCPVQAPDNDLCSSVTPEDLAIGGSLQFTGTTAGATSTDDFAPGSALDGLGATVWHAFSTTECADVTIDYCGTAPPFLSVWIFLSPDCPAGDDYILATSSADDVTCGDGNLTLQYPGLPAGTYYLPVMFHGTFANGPYTINVSAAACPAPPENDDCANAIILPVHAVGECPDNAVEGNNASATQDGGDPDCDTTTGQFRDVWYTFESGTNTSVTITITPGDMEDLVLEVLEGTGCDGNSVMCTIGTLSNDVEVAPGNTYTVRVSSNTQWGAGGSFSICINETAPPYEPCASITPVACNTPTSTGTISGEGAWLFPSCDFFADTPGQERIYMFTPPEDGDYTITVTDLSDGYVDIFWKPVALGCDENNWTCHAYVWAFDTPTTLDPITLTAGQPIYVMIDPEHTAPTEVTFQIDCVTVGCSDPNFYLNVTLASDGPLPTWEIREVGTDALVQSGGGGTGFEGPNQEWVCAPESGNYYLVMDGGSIGTTYELRTADGASARVIDNVDPVASTHQVTEYGSSNGTIQVPVAETRLIHTSCDKYWWTNNEYIVANEVPEVAAEWVPGGTNAQQDATTGYDFWIYDPNGGYSFIRERRHNNADGFGSSSSTRTCHMRLNGWTASVGPAIPANVPLNVRVRAVVNGVPRNWGPACRFVLDPVMASCPPTNLISVPDHQYYSCGVIKQFTSSNSNRIFAQPVSGADQYEFQFRLAGGAEGGWDITRTVSTYYLNLGWSVGTAPPLVAGSTYDVRVRARKGGEWCVYGPLCQLTISSGMAGGGQNSAVDDHAAALGLWPNPNRGDQLYVSLSSVPEGVGTIGMDMYDLSGKRITARTLPVQHGHVYTVVDLNGDLAAGVYMVRITAGERTFTERLVIQP
jgi:hypothetical protein